MLSCHLRDMYKKENISRCTKQAEEIRQSQRSQRII